MKRILLIIMVCLLLSGCGIYDLDNFVTPNDTEFIAVIDSLDTPEKICQYMQDNFIYKYHSIYDPDPYTLWQTKKGDCNDMATFGTWVANYHGYTTYQIQIFFNDTLISHYIGVFVEDGKYTSSSNYGYYKWRCESFKEIVAVHSNCWKKYKVYDYNNNIIEEVNNGRIN